MKISPTGAPAWIRTSDAQLRSSLQPKRPFRSSTLGMQDEENFDRSTPSTHAPPPVYFDCTWPASLLSWGHWETLDPHALAPIGWRLWTTTDPSVGALN